MSRYSLEREGTKVRVTMVAELTVSFVPELRELLCAIHDDGVQDLVLDFSKTTALDVAGLGRRRRLFALLAAGRPRVPVTLPRNSIR